MTTKITEVSQDVEQPHRQLQQAIKLHIREHPHYPGPEEAHIVGRRISVLNIITALLFAGGDFQSVAREYDLEPDAVRAAVWYYDLHKQAIDVRMARERAAFAPQSARAHPQA